jgi:hypothetical protein
MQDETLETPLTLEQRVARLEARQPVPGPQGPRGERGPAGNIDAARENAEQIARQIVTGVLADLTSRSRIEEIDKRLNDHYQSFRGLLSASNERTNEELSSLRKYLEDEVAAIVVQLLEEYGVLKLADNHICGGKGGK